MNKRLRLLSIVTRFVARGLDQLILPGMHAPSRWFFIRLKKHQRADILVKTLIALGPLFIKFGQLLSTRRDLLPDDIADALSILQDQVPPFDFAIVKERVHKHFGTQSQHVFSHIEETALGSASIAQVHAATLHDGSQVVIKLLRPHIHAAVQQDIALLYRLARFIHFLYPQLNRLKLTEVVDEINQTITKELDLTHEAANGSQLRRNFLISTKMYVPKMYWDFCFHDLIVMERVHGVPIKDVETLKSSGTNLARLAHHGTEIFLQQVFEDNFFHADMHPGNLFVDITNPAFPIYQGVDFGICASLTPEDQRYIAENLVAFFHQDYYKIAELHVDSGWVPKDTSIQHFAAQIRAVCEPIINRPLKEISFAKLMDGLIHTARSFNMEVQPQLLLLQKTIFNIEGLGRDLYPDMNLWDQAKPFLERWVRQQHTPVKKIQQWLKSLETKPIEPIPETRKTDAHWTKHLALLGTLIGLGGMTMTPPPNLYWILPLTLIPLLILWQN